MTDADYQQLEEMKTYSEVNFDMPDGAFFALAEQMNGWTVEDWVWYEENKSALKKRK